MAELIQMLLHVWLALPGGASRPAWFLALPGYLPYLLALLLALFCLRRSGAPGRARSLATWGVLMLLGSSTLEYAFAVLLVQDAPGMRWLWGQPWALRALWLVPLLAALLAYAMLFGVLLRAWQRAIARGAAIAAFVFLAGAAALRQMPALLYSGGGYFTADIASKILLCNIVSTLLWLVGFGLLMRALITLLRHSDI